MDSDDLMAIAFFGMMAVMALGGLVVGAIVMAGDMGINPLFCAGSVVVFGLVVVIKIAMVWFSISKDGTLEDTPSSIPSPAMRRLLRRAAAIAEERGDLPPELVERYRRYRDRERMVAALCVLLALASLLRNVYGILIMAFVFCVLDWPFRTRKNDALYDIARHAGLVKVPED